MMKKGLQLTILLSFFVLNSCMECTDDCPAPPPELRFQIVDIYGYDLTRSRRAKYDNKLVSLDYLENDIETSTVLELDTFEDGKTIFIASEIPKLAERGITKFRLYASPESQADTLAVGLSKVESYCCSYPVYNYLLKDDQPQEKDSLFVFLVQK